MLIGSSIGNFDDQHASSLLRDLRHAVGARGALLIGMDLRKERARLLAAYNDGAGVTAAKSNKNLLARINRELGGHFDLDRFRHVARWNESASSVEMHLESLGRQKIRIDSLNIVVGFESGETIHTESSVKYDDLRARRILAFEGGFEPSVTYYDGERLFAVHMARAQR